MPQARDEAGNIWEVDAQGNPVRLLQAAGPQGPAPITIGAPDPTTPYKVPSAQADLTGQQLNNQVTAATAPYAAPKAAADARKAEADARKAEISAEVAATERQSTPNPEMARIKTTLQTDNVLRNISAARRQIGEGGATGNFFGGGFWQGVPFLGQNSADLHAALSGIEGAVINDTLNAMRALSATGSSGLGALSEREGQRLAASVAALQQTQSEDELLRNLATLERHYRNSLAILNNEDPRIPEIAEKYGILPADGGGSNSGPDAPRELTSEGRTVNDPALAGANAQVRSMIAAGRPAQEIREYLNRLQPGLGDQTQNLEEAVAFAGQYPERANEVPVDVESRWEPAGGLSRVLGDIGMSPVGAGVIGAADFASMGSLDNLVGLTGGNAEQARAAMMGVQEENPNAYLVGQILGGVTSGIGAEAALGRTGLGALGRARAGDALLGAGYAAGSADDPADSRIAQALLGAGAGVAGGMAGRGAARLAGRAMTGVADPTVRTLNDAGISLTPGQILGGGVQRTEDRIAGLPLVGDAIHARRREGVRDFNRAVFDEAMQPIGGRTATDIGAAGADANQGAVSTAYRNALGGSQVMPEDQFADDLAAAVMGIRNVPRIGDEVVDSVGEIVNPTYFDEVTGALSGENVQPMLQELRKLRTSYQNDPLGNRVGDGIRSVEDAVIGMFERQAPDVMPAYRAADAAYRRQSIVDDAVLRALNQGGEFTPAQLGMSMKANARQFGGKRAAARGDMPFAEIQGAAQSILPSQIPDSGTAGRLILPLAAGSALGGGQYAVDDEASAGSSATTGAIIAALLATPYSRPAQSLVQKALLAERPELLMRYGNSLLDNRHLAGLLAAPSATMVVTESAQPQPSQSSPSPRASY